jgi:hypothetical protein
MNGYQLFAIAIEGSAVHTTYWQADTPQQAIRECYRVFPSPLYMGHYVHDLALDKYYQRAMLVKTELPPLPID